MSEFCVDLQGIRNSNKSIEETGFILQQVGKSVDLVLKNKTINSENMHQIKDKLSNLHECILDEAVKASNISSALERIIVLYQQAENSICNSGLDVEVCFDPESNISDSFKKKWDELLEDIREWLLLSGILSPEAQSSEGEITRRQEKEQDLYMKKQIAELSKQEKYSEKTWKNATVEERKKLLNEYIQEVAEMMGLEVDEINFTYSKSQNGYANMGAYSQSTNRININEWIIESGDKEGFSSYSLYTTVVHELRHAYQYSAINNPEKFVVTEETLTKWRDSFDKYKQQSGFIREGMSERDAYNAYRAQEVEVDARNFAGQR